MTTSRRFILAPAARQDLNNLWDYIAEESPQAADRVINALRASLRNLAEHPEMGRQRDELIPHLRSFPSQRHVIFYRHDSETITVLRVLHEARDVPVKF